MTVASGTKPPALADVRIGIVGLGYVGLPLAVNMARRFSVMGFDVDRKRIDELTRGVDRTEEVSRAELAAASALRFTSDTVLLRDANFIIVTVPTPIDAAKRPDLRALESASRLVGSIIRPGTCIVYESTVYPGATEEHCIPIIEQASGMKLNRDFFAGYSPERINPGDTRHRLPDILKVTSGSTVEAADLVDAVYASVITAGTFKASSIRVAEAAKVIENIQRDVNIALVNELALLFKRLGLETREVLQAAGTKWNFHGYTPGLVGGHCIGVDPYYLTHKAQSIGFHPEMILAGRRINDAMAGYVAGDIVKTLLKRRVRVDQARILVLGFTFKENCPDVRNTKVVDLVRELDEMVACVDIYDPRADRAAALDEHGLAIAGDLPEGPYEALVLAVRHDEIMALGRQQLGKLLAPSGIVYDVKGVLPIGDSDARL